ncbi:MAG: GAF domain-containing protein [Deltaproteobacteria bacterium]|nr:GAF domain-containing protein [Deltaproteobacteria bacterium]
MSGPRESEQEREIDVVSPADRANLRARPIRAGEVIRDRREAILASWLQRVRGERDRPQVAALVEAIAVLADHLSTGTTPVPELPADALEALGDGIDLTEIVGELGILRDSIVRIWDVPDPRLLELRIVDQAIDRAIAAAIDRHARARDRTLAAVDRISNAALASRSLDELLDRLLRVLVDSAATVDCAAILLREGDVLRVRASMGPDDGGRLGATERIGEGFAGTIAFTGRPLEVTRPAADPEVVRAVYGVPLLDNGEPIGVAHMASATVTEFSRQDRQMLAAIANRATSAIVQHLLRERAEHAAERLREREREFRTLADNIPQLAWMADAAGVVYWVNRRWIEHTGVDVLAMHGDPMTAHHPEHRLRVAASWDVALERGEPWEDTFPIRDRTGRYRWFLSRAIPIRNERGTVDRWFGTNTDVTAQRFLDEATKLLNASLDYGKTLQELARLAVPDMADWCVVDLVVESGAIRRTCAHDDPQMVERARAWNDRYPPDPAAPTGSAKVIRTGEVEFHAEVTDRDLVQIARDEEHLESLRRCGVRSLVTAPLVARDRVFGAVTLVTTESGRRYNAQDVEVARELGRRAGMAVDNARLYHDSQQATRTREEVLAIVSHDLRNPLGAISLAAANLVIEHGAAPTSRRLLELIGRSTSRMEHLIDNLLDMASIEARGLSLSLAPHDPALLVRNVVETDEAVAAERKIAIAVDCDFGGAQLVCDGDRIEQLLGNLLSNATKYCRPGDRVTVRGRLAGDRAEFVVEDNGPGIAPDEIPFLFQPYWAARRSAVRKGTGLGLYICKGIVDAHGGAIWVQSQPGQGASFGFSIPMRAPPAAA